MSIKLLLNCFPPTSLYMPSIGCEVVSKYITAKNGVDTEVIYWNYLFQDRSSEGEINLFEADNDLYQILPFLSILAEGVVPEVHDRLLLKMQETNPSFKTLGEDYYKKKLKKQVDRINKIIDDQLKELLSDEFIVFGVSAKFDSWIPGVVVAREVKKRRPDAICVLGGIEEENAANVLFEEYDVFDFAIWGEGEIPMSLLIERLTKKDEDYSQIPRLLNRYSLSEDGNILFENANRDKGFLDIKEYPDINYDTYFEYAKEINKGHIQLPIETSRGCRWNKCNFCALSWGNLYRTQDLDSIVIQLRSYYLKYGILRYFFVDNDIVGKDIRLFEKLLDKLIKLSSELEVDFDFHADILHLNFNKRIIQKLSLAGFKSVQVGYEGVSDSMLKKLNKSTTFAENLLFVKFAQKYDIEVTITGLIIGIPGENEEDVFESTNNLHFLRFFLGENKKELQHTFSKLVLFYETEFWEMMSQSEREKFSTNSLNDLLPNDFIKNPYVAYSLLGQWATPPLMDKWHSFKVTSDFYEKAKFKYYLIEANEEVNYLEYKEDLKIESLTFDQPEYWDVLKIANDQVISLKKLYREIQKKYSEMNLDRLIEIVIELKGSYLLYCSKDRNKIVSIIDTDRL